MYLNKIFTFVIIFFLLYFIPLENSQADHASASFETGAAGAIMTTPGATLPENRLVFGLSSQFIEFDDISDPVLEAFGTANEDVHSTDNLLSFKANLAYGLTDNLTLGISIPWIVRNNIRAAHNDGGVGEVELAGDSAGFGDVSVFGQFRFLRDQSQDLSLIAGVKAPTGTTDEREAEGKLFEADHQPGSGSWDPFFGIAWNRSVDRLGLSANVLYTLMTEGTQQTTLGDAFNYNLALSYRLFKPEESHGHHEHGTHDHNEHRHGLIDYVDVVIELNGDYRDQDDIAGTSEENSGGNILYLSPGARIGQ